VVKKEKSVTIEIMKNSWLIIGSLVIIFSIGVLLVKPKNISKETPKNETQEQIVTSSPLINPSPANIVPLPTSEDIIRTFFNLINEARIPEAVEMLSQTANPNDSTKQAWGVSFNSFKSVDIISIEPWDKSSWNTELEIYKVVFDLQLKSGDFAYGWDGGQNTRWIEIAKKPASLWKINAFATGP